MPRKSNTSIPVSASRHLTSETNIATGIHSAHQPMMAELYRRAEARLRGQAQGQQAKAQVRNLDADTARVFHEWEVRKIELEMQNVELRKARDEQEVTLENYTDLYDFAPVGYFSLDESGVILETNLTSAALLGRERSRLVNRRLLSFMSPANRPLFLTFLKKVFTGTPNQVCETLLLKEDGGTFPASFRATSAVSLKGTRKWCRVAFGDITERKQAAEQIRLSEVRYRRLFETAHDGVLLLDPGTRKITDANPFMTKLLGYSHEQLVGKELFEIGLLKDKAASQEMFQKLKRKHEVRYEDLSLDSQTGRHQQVDMVANFYQENDHPVIHCNIRDITERKHAEIALSRLAAIVEFSDDAIIGEDLNGIITSWNTGAEKIFGYTAREMVGASIGRLIPPVRRHEEKMILGKINRGESLEHFETLRKTKGGRLIDISVTVSPIKDATGKVIGASKVARDITERKQAEKAQRRIEVLAASNRKLEQEIARRQAADDALKQSHQHQHRLLEQSHQMQEQLRHLSHQLLSAQEDERTRISRELHDVIAQTLTSINLRLATLKKEATLSPKAMERSIVRTQELVARSVDIVHRFARELRPTALDDLGLIPALKTFMKSFKEQTGIQVSLSVFAAVEQVNADKRTVLYRVAQEALTNVARHAKASRANVKIQKLDDAICMVIKDNGKGFPAERLLQAKKHKRLGLLGMRERVQMVNGNFAIQSALGQSTSIRVQIPLAENGGNGFVPASPARNGRVENATNWRQTGTG